MVLIHERSVVHKLIHVTFFVKENRGFSSGDEFFARLRERSVLNFHDSLIGDKFTEIFRLFSIEFS